MEHQHEAQGRTREAPEMDGLTRHTPLPDRVPLHPILQLQQGIGNRAVQRLLASRDITLQAKLTVGAAHDPYEQEADRVAQRVVNMATPPFAVTGQASVPPQSPEMDEAAQTKPLADTITTLVQCAPGEDDIQTKAMMQRALPDPQGSFEPGTDFETLLSAGGIPLSASTRAFMEPRFRADFSEVRLHTDGEAAQLNRAVGAQAFTHGQDIYLGEGKNDVESSAGKQLLAHELTHTIQQSAAGALRFSGLVQRAPSTKELGQLYDEAVQSEDWFDAAETLNGFNREDITSRLAKLSSAQIASLHQGALDNPRVGPQSQLAQMTEPGTPRASTMPPVSSQAELPARRITIGTSGLQADTGVPFGDRDPLQPGIDYPTDSAYIDNIVHAWYDILANRFNVDHQDGTSIDLDFDSIRRVARAGAPPVEAFQGGLFFRNRRNGKIYPVHFTATNIPNIVGVWREIEKQMPEALEKLEGALIDVAISAAGVAKAGMNAEKKMAEAAAKGGSSGRGGGRGGSGNTGGGGGPRDPARIKSEVFGKGLEGTPSERADQILKQIQEGTYKPPSDLTKEHLLDYKNTILRETAKGRPIDKSGVQEIRIKIIDELLKRFFS